MRYLLRLSYHGGPFRGFAPNEGVPTVGGALCVALETIVRHPVSITCAGRTDAGVHATDQAVHFDTDVEVDPDGLRGSLNGLCKPHIAVRSIEQVADDFDARFSCTGRTYRYRLLNRRVPDPFRHEVTWRVDGELDIQAMNAAGAALVGTHDFSSFCRKQFADVDGAEVEKTRVRDLRRVAWTRAADEEVHLMISASSFCQQMVRSITGLCVDVGLGRVSVEGVPGILAAQDRTRVPRVAPPQGLFLERVDYA
ncbi:MAG: tRNA pseudouridine(38-40) synthase TruA [Actinomycetota bacterium]